MNKIWSFTIRNLKRYFRDKSALFFSLLSVFIVIALYGFFLSDMQIETIKALVGDVPGIDHMIYHWIFGGLLCIPAISVPLILLTFKVDDVVEGVQDDLFVTPINRTYLMLGYITAACIAGIIMTIITLVLGEIFIVSKGGQLLSIASYFKIIGISSIIILAFSGFSFFIISPLKSSSALTVVNTILNTLIGFLAGLYVPIGFLSDGIDTVIKVFPLSHATSLLRQIMMKSSMEQVFQNAPISVINQIRQNYGIDLVVGNHMFKQSEMLLILVIFGLVFYISSVILLKNSKRS